MWNMLLSGDMTYGLKTWGFSSPRHSSSAVFLTWPPNQVPKPPSTPRNLKMTSNMLSMRRTHTKKTTLKCRWTVDFTHGLQCLGGMLSLVSLPFNLLKCAPKALLLPQSHLAMSMRSAFTRISTLVPEQHRLPGLVG